MTDVLTEEKILCYKCGVYRTRAEYDKDKYKANGLRRPCRVCRQKQQVVLREANRARRESDLADGTKLKICSKCHHAKPIEKFPPNADCDGGTLPWCRACESKKHTAWRDANREHVRARGNETMRNLRAKNPERARAILRKFNLKRNYGLTEAAFEKMLADQNRACAICEKPFGRGKPNRNIHVDHNHQTGAIRGLLCSRCNNGIGCLDDSEELVFAALLYLQKHRGAP